MKQKAKQQLAALTASCNIDFTYLAKGSFWLSIAKGFIALSGVALSAAYAHFLSPETFGIYKYIISVSGIISALTLSGLYKPLISAVARGAEGMLRAGWRASTLWNIDATLVAISGAVYYYLQGNTSFALSMLIVAALMPLQKSTETYASFLVGKRLFKAQSTYSIIENILFVTVMAITVYVTNNPLWLILAFFATKATTTLFFFARTERIHKANTTVDTETIPFAKHLTLIDFFAIAAKHVDKILVFQLLGPVELAVYTFATFPVEQLTGTIPQMIHQLSLPKLVRRNMAEIKRAIRRKLALLLGMALTIIVLYVLLIPFVFELLFPVYTGAIIYSQIFVGIILFIFPKSLLSSVFIAHIQKKDLYIVNISTALLKILLFATLIPLFHIWGVIFARMGAQFVSLLVHILLLKKK